MDPSSNVSPPLVLMKHVLTPQAPAESLIVIVLPGIWLVRGRTSVPGLTLVLARTKSVDSPMLDIHLTLYLEGKALYIHRGRSSDHEVVVIEDRGVLVYVSCGMIWKLVLESYRTNIHLCCAHSEGLDAARKHRPSAEREGGAR